MALLKEVPLVLDDFRLFQVQALAAALQLPVQQLEEELERVLQDSVVALQVHARHRPHIVRVRLDDLQVLALHLGRDLQAVPEVFS